MAQAQQHNRYERAARELVMKAREALKEEHQREMNELRLQLESDAVRKTVGAEMKLKALDEQAREEQEDLREEAQGKISQLEETIEELESQLAKANGRADAAEEAAREEVAQMQGNCDAMLSALEEAQQETELKRETNMKLKDEIIGNDHLTVANLNRIKHLEQENTKINQHADLLEQENEELREELLKNKDEKENGASDDEVKELKAVLAEREAQLISISHRLAEATGGNNAGSGAGSGAGIGGMLSPIGRRDSSLMERFGFANMKSSSSFS
uniref:Myosin tail domain-containing protein n=1 Tax=Haptolina brevifila TaxID=156173 RepID=A0A7S2GN15_9EUKA|mmetsp:Transcript_40528/g.81299  ORF Transcript_40528/g.81299 Transcript_40528/m.81299 type:complete len:273 (+) Transcript_40528:441-1259(+)